MSDSSGLQSGECGLTDGSTVGDWKLPNLFELESLRDMENYNPSLPSGHPFMDVENFYYWSSTTGARNTNSALAVSMGNGIVYYLIKGDPETYVWPVRGGH